MKWPANKSHRPKMGFCFFCPHLRHPVPNYYLFPFLKDDDALAVHIDGDGIAFLYLPF